MSKVEWGKKVVCSNCETKFYDLNRKPAVCPNCGTEYIEPALDSTPTNAKQVFTDEISASTGRCMSAEIAVGTVITNVICHLSINFQKLSNTPSPRYPCGVGKTTCAPELTIAINIT